MAVMSSLSDSGTNVPANSPIVICLVGITGEGKSTTGNTISGDKNAFKASAKAKSETCDCGFHDFEVNGVKYRVIDTPGLQDTNLTPQELHARFKQFADLAPQGVDSFFFVCKRGRFKPEYTAAFKTFQEACSTDALQHTGILFTGLDDDEDNEEFTESLIQESHEVPGLAQCLARVNFRVIGIDNKGGFSRKEGDRKLVFDLVEKIRSINIGKRYSNEHLQEAEEWRTGIEAQADQLEDPKHQQAMNYELSERLHGRRERGQVEAKLLELQNKENLARIAREEAEAARRAKEEQARIEEEKRREWERKKAELEAQTRQETLERSEERKRIFAALGGGQLQTMWDLQPKGPEGEDAVQPEAERREEQVEEGAAKEQQNQFAPEAEKTVNALAESVGPVEAATEPAPIDAAKEPAPMEAPEEPASPASNVSKGGFFSKAKRGLTSMLHLDRGEAEAASNGQQREMEQDVPLQAAPEKLRISIMHATGLKHQNHLSGDNIFCVCEVAGKTWSTSKVKNSLEPKWNETMEMQWTSDANKVTISILNKGVLADKTEGTVEVSKEQFLVSTFEGELPIVGCANGILFLRIEPLFQDAIEGQLGPLADITSDTKIMSRELEEPSVVKDGIKIWETRALTPPRSPSSMTPRLVDPGPSIVTDLTQKEDATIKPEIEQKPEETTYVPMFFSLGTSDAAADKHNETKSETALDASIFFAPSTLGTSGSEAEARSDTKPAAVESFFFTPSTLGTSGAEVEARSDTKPAAVESFFTPSTLGTSGAEAEARSDTKPAAVESFFTPSTLGTSEAEVESRSDPKPLAVEPSSFTPRTFGTSGAEAEARSDPQPLPVESSSLTPRTLEARNIPKPFPIGSSLFAPPPRVLDTRDDAKSLGSSLTPRSPTSMVSSPTMDTRRGGSKALEQLFNSPLLGTSRSPLGTSRSSVLGKTSLLDTSGSDTKSFSSMRIGCGPSLTPNSFSPRSMLSEPGLDTKRDAKPHEFSFTSSFLGASGSDSKPRGLMSDSGDAKAWRHRIEGQMEEEVARQRKLQSELTAIQHKQSAAEERLFQARKYEFASLGSRSGSGGLSRGLETASSDRALPTFGSLSSRGLEKEFHLKNLMDSRKAEPDAQSCRSTEIGTSASRSSLWGDTETKVEQNKPDSIKLLERGPSIISPEDARSNIFIPKLRRTILTPQEKRSLQEEQEKKSLLTPSERKFLTPQTKSSLLTPELSSLLRTVSKSGSLSHLSNNR